MIVIRQGYGLFRAAVTGLSRVAGAISAALIFILMFVVVYEVMLRYVLRQPTRWSFELSGFMLTAIVLLSLSYVLEKDRHIRVVILSSRLSPQASHWLYVFTSFFSFVLCVLVTKAAWDFTWLAYQNCETSIGGLEAPMFLVKGLVLLGVGLLGLRFVVDACEHIRALRRKYPEPQQH